MEIQELINGCKNWNKKAQNELYETYASRLFAVCLRYIPDRDNACDVLQESMIKIYKNIGSFSHSDDDVFYFWMKRITVNTALNYIRDNIKNKLNTDIEHVENEFTDENNAGFSQYDDMIEFIGSQKLFNLIQELPVGYRTVFNLYVVEDFNHKEIAEQLDITVNTSKTQLFKARKMLISRICEIMDRTSIIKEVI